MKSIFLFLFGLSIFSRAQIQKPITWSYAAKKVNGTEAIIYVKAVIEDGWHIYSVNQKAGGPEKTTFSFFPSKEFSLIGNVMEPKPIKKYEDVFEMDVFYFKHEVLFQQKIKLNSPFSIVRGKVSFMVCTEKECLPTSEVNFSVPVK